MKCMHLRWTMLVWRAMHHILSEYVPLRIHNATCTMVLVVSFFLNPTSCVVYDVFCMTRPNDILLYSTSTITHISWDMVLATRNFAVMFRITDFYDCTGLILWCMMWHLFYCMCEILRWWDKTEIIEGADTYSHRRKTTSPDHASFFPSCVHFINPLVAQHRWSRTEL